MIKSLNLSICYMKVKTNQVHNTNTSSIMYVEEMSSTLWRLWRLRPNINQGERLLSVNSIWVKSNYLANLLNIFFIFLYILTRFQHCSKIFVLLLRKSWQFYGFQFSDAVLLLQRCCTSRRKRYMYLSTNNYWKICQHWKNWWWKSSGSRYMRSISTRLSSEWYVRITEHNTWKVK